MSEPMSREARLVYLRNQVGEDWPQVLPEEVLLELGTVIDAAVPRRGVTMRDAVYRFARVADKLHNEMRRRARTGGTLRG